MVENSGVAIELFKRHTDLLLIQALNAYTTWTAWIFIFGEKPYLNTASVKTDGE